MFSMRSLNGEYSIIGQWLRVGVSDLPFILSVKSVERQVHALGEQTAFDQITTIDQRGTSVQNMISMNLPLCPHAPFCSFDVQLATVVAFDCHLYSGDN
jgi:hypothetical protein